MCGIVGYIGPRQCAPILLEALRRLEYRGYDSAGLAVLQPDAATQATTLELVRTVGKLQRLDEALRGSTVHGTVGVGHTRWATHGRPTEANAHPHRVGDVAVVHNGILENHAELRAELVARGRVFQSETDTEIAAHLIDAALAAGAPTLAAAVREALGRVRGAFAIVVVSRAHPDVLVAARSFSPLVLGAGEGEMFIASDVPALLSHTRSVVFLDDGELAEVRAGSYAITALADGRAVARAPRRVDWSPAEAEKQGHKHFMLKEILEQPAAVENTLHGHLSSARAEIDPDTMGLSLAEARAVERVVLVACGTSHHAAMVGRHWLEALARVPAQVELASEFRGRDVVLERGDLVVAVSQSGETADTLAAVREARRRGARVLALVNVVDSAIARAADGALYTFAGPEIGVASTKCFTTQLAALLMLAVHLGGARGAIPADRAHELLRHLLEVPAQMRAVLEHRDQLRQMASHQLLRDDAHSCLFLGRGLSYPIALEGALKLKEISYLHAEGYAAGEMKHGPIALIDARLPVVVVAPHDGHYEKIASNVHEVRARDGRVLAVVSRGDRAVAEGADAVFELPTLDPELSPFVSILPLQLLAYHAADLKGTDVDQPRNLAKTVTVE